MNRESNICKKSESLTEVSRGKFCRSCGKTKEKESFNKCRSKSDGLQSSCKTCQRLRNKRYIKSELGLKTRSEYYKSPAAKQSMKQSRIKYKQSEKGKRSKKRYYLNHKDLHRAIGEQQKMSGKKRAYGKVQTAIRNGRLKRMNICSICLTQTKTDMHHYHGYDDDKALMVIELCRKCHGREHATPLRLFL